MSSTSSTSSTCLNVSPTSHRHSCRNTGAYRPSLGPLQSVCNGHHPLLWMSSKRGTHLMVDGSQFTDLLVTSVPPTTIQPNPTQFIKIISSYFPKIYLTRIGMNDLLTSNVSNKDSECLQSHPQTN